MNQFEEYLKLKKYRSSTITAHIANINRFFKWTSSQGYKVQDTSYNNLLNYIQASKSRGVIDKLADCAAEVNEKPLNGLTAN